MNGKIYLVIIGFLIGILIHSQFLGFNKFEESAKRDTILSNIQQAYILAQSNNELSSEIQVLDEKLEDIKNAAVSMEAIENEISVYNTIGGNLEASGTGIYISINLPVESYWVIDIVNELNLAGAEAVSINEHRVTCNTSLLTTYDVEPIIVLDETNPISVPIMIKAIGDPELLKKYIEQDSGTLKRLESALPEFNDLYTISSSDTVRIAASR